MRKRFWVVAALLFSVVLAGCSSLAETKPDQVGIRYSGADWGAEAEVFKQCYAPGIVEYGDPGDKIYYYPAGQRTFKFASNPDGSVQVGADAPAMKVTAARGVELEVAGTVTFTPNFLNCDTLRDFHERIGRKYGASIRAEDDTTTSVVEGLEGWQLMLGTYLRDPIDRAVDNVSLQYEWNMLSSDAATKAQWESQALEAIPEVMRQQSGGDFWTVNSIILQKPTPPASLTAAIEGQETAALNAKAAQTAAEASAACNSACQAYQLNQALIEAMRNGNVPVIPIPSGSAVNLTVPQAPVPQ